jgi:5'-3' exonuclease
MNQQRQRRFRTATENAKARQKNGDTRTDYFDSNCITPGLRAGRFADDLTATTRVQARSSWRD